MDAATVRAPDPRQGARAAAVSATLPMLTDAQLVAAAEHLAKHARLGQSCTLHAVLCGRLADALLAVVERRANGS